ncbi:MAG: oligosaccharide flippase family protein [Minisyncoccia bacterium]
MSVIRTIGTGIAWNTAGTIIGKIVGFANIFIILTHLTVYEYGLVELTMSIVSTMGMFLLPGLTSTVTADLTVERGRHDFGKMKALFLEYFTFTIALGILAWAVLFFGSSYVAHWTGNDLIDRFFKIVSFLFLTSPLRVITTMLAGVMLRYADQSFYSVVEEVAKGAFLVIFFFVFARGADGLLFATVLAQVVALLIFLPRTLSAYRVFGGAVADVREPLWNILRDHRKWSVASSYVGTFGQNLRLWIIKLMLGTEAVGLFAFAQGIVAHATGLFNFSTVFAPVLPNFLADRARLGQIVTSVTKYQVYISTALAAVLVATVPFAIPYIFPHYSSAIPLLLVLFFTIVPNLIKAFHLTVFLVLKHQWGWFVIETIRTIGIGIVLPVCIWLFGLPGIALEVVLTSTFIAVERWRGLKKLLPEFYFRTNEFFQIDETDRRIFNMVRARIKEVANRDRKSGIL